MDDDEGLRTCIAEYLEGRGHQIHQACDGFQASVYLEHLEADLVISDIQMPRMDGITLLKTLRKRSNDVPVILMTGDGSFKQTVEALRSQAYRFFRKPIKLHELQACVDQLVERTQARTQ